MKKTIVTLILLMTSCILFAQLSNSKWKGTLKGDNPQEVIFDFRKDTAVVYTVSDNSMIETMTYTVKDMVLTLMKIEGISDCDNSTPGKYKIGMANDALYLTVVDDKCEDRASAVDSIKWVKLKSEVNTKVNAAGLQGAEDYEPEAAQHIYNSLGNGHLHTFGADNNLSKSAMNVQPGLNRSLLKAKAEGVEIDFVKNENGDVAKYPSLRRY
jgi:hypothetical protein